MNILMEYMLREISAGRFHSEINEEKFPYMLGLDKYIKQRKKNTSNLFLNGLLVFQI